MKIVRKFKNLSFHYTTPSGHIKCCWRVKLSVFGIYFDTTFQALLCNKKATGNMKTRHSRLMIVNFHTKQRIIEYLTFKRKEFQTFIILYDDGIFHNFLYCVLQVCCAISKFLKRKKIN